MHALQVLRRASKRPLEHTFSCKVLTLPCYSWLGELLLTCSTSYARIHLGIGSRPVAQRFIVERETPVSLASRYCDSRSRRSAVRKSSVVMEMVQADGQ